MTNYAGETLESMSQAVWYNRWTLNKFEQYLKGEILEIGCGIGNFSNYLSAYGKLTAIDVNKEYVKEAKDKIDVKGDIGLGDIEKGDYFFKDKLFNTIVCINVLEHIKDDTQALRNIYKLLAPDGYLILLVPAQKFLFNSIDDSIGHYRRYEKDKINTILEQNNFEIKISKKLNFLGSIGWFIAGNLFKEERISEGKIKAFNLISPIFLFLENLFEPPIGTSILIIARKKE